MIIITFQQIGFDVTEADVPQPPDEHGNSKIARVKTLIVVDPRSQIQAQIPFDEPAAEALMNKFQSKKIDIHQALPGADLPIDLSKIRAPGQ